MTIGVTTAFPQHSTSTNHVISEYINVEGYFQKSEEDNANGKEIPGTIWRFIYDIRGRRNQLVVINPYSMSDESNMNPEPNRYYRVTGYAIQPKESFTYLFFLSAVLT
jgi:hypothetical protein